MTKINFINKVQNSTNNNYYYIPIYNIYNNLNINNTKIFVRNKHLFFRNNKIMLRVKY